MQTGNQLACTPTCATRVPLLRVSVLFSITSFILIIVFTSHLILPTISYLPPVGEENIENTARGGGVGHGGRQS